MHLLDTIQFIFANAIEFITNMPAHLNAWAVQMGGGFYGLLFLIIFAETGLVVTPFLPGDSLLFAVGALSATPGSKLSLSLIWLLLIAAALLGDTVNYLIGNYLGTKLFSTSKILNLQHLKRTRDFYARHGGKTIVLARFIPIVRTYAPFVAGVSATPYRRFITFSICGAVLWISSFLLGGFYFGAIPQVKSNFHLVIIAIIVISVLPALLEFCKARRATRLPKTHPKTDHAKLPAKKDLV